MLLLFLPGLWLTLSPGAPGKAGRWADMREHEAQGAHGTARRRGGKEAMAPTVPEAGRRSSPRRARLPHITCSRPPRQGLRPLSLPHSHFPPRHWIHRKCGWSQTPETTSCNSLVGQIGRLRPEEGQELAGATEDLSEDRGRAFRPIPCRRWGLKAPCYPTVATAPPWPRTRPRFPGL